MFDSKLYKSDPRSFALGLIEDGLVSSETLITACLKYMSHDEVREMHDMNELSPRFDADNEVEHDNDTDTEN